MDRESIESELHGFVANEIIGDDADLTSSTNLLALGIIDSLSMVSLRIFIERTFKVRLPDRIEPESFTSIASIADMTMKLRAEAADAAK